MLVCSNTLDIDTNHNNSHTVIVVAPLRSLLLTQRLESMGVVLAVVLALIFKNCE